MRRKSFGFKAPRVKKMRGVKFFKVRRGSSIKIFRLKSWR